MTSPANTSDRETGTVERLVADLQAGLEGVTPGPWTAFYKAKYDEWHVSVPMEGVGFRQALFADGCPTGEADAKWIARCSPDNIAAILEDRARLKARADTADRENERLRQIAHHDPRTIMIAHEDGDHERLSRAAAKAIDRAESAEAKLATAREALRGDPEMPEQISPLSWLAEAVKELKARGPADDCEDTGAYWEMVSECEALERNGRTALRLITEGADHERS